MLENITLGHANIEQDLTKAPDFRNYGVGGHMILVEK